MKDPYLVQHVGGAVAAIEGGDDFALASGIDGNLVQVWHPDPQLVLPSGPLSQHLDHCVLCGQLGREAVSSIDMNTNTFSFKPKKQVSEMRSRGQLLSLPTLLLCNQMPLELLSLRKTCYS